MIATDSSCLSLFGAKYSVEYRSLWYVRPLILRYSRIEVVREAEELALQCSISSHISRP